jgi:hypothetical protein
MESIDEIIELKRDMDSKNQEISDMGDIHKELTLECKRLEHEREGNLKTLESLFLKSSDAVLTQLPDRTLIDRIIALKKDIDSKKRELSEYEEVITTCRSEYKSIESKREKLLVKLLESFEETPPAERFNISKELNKAVPHMNGIKSLNVTPDSVYEEEARADADYKSVIKDALSPKVKALLASKRDEDEAEAEEIQRNAAARKGGTRRKRRKTRR